MQWISGSPGAACAHSELAGLARGAPCTASASLRVGCATGLGGCGCAEERACAAVHCGALRCEAVVPALERVSHPARGAAALPAPRAALAAAVLRAPVPGQLLLLDGRTCPPLRRCHGSTGIIASAMLVDTAQ